MAKDFLDGDDIEMKDVVVAVQDVLKGFEEYKKTQSDIIDEAIKGSVDTLLTEKLERIDKDLDEKQEMIDKFYTMTKRKHVTVDGKEVDQEELDAKAFNWADICMKRKGSAITEFTHEELTEYKKAFAQFLRKDDRRLEPEEMKALSVGSDPDGGYTVHPDMNGRIVQRIFETSPIRSYASVQVISTDALEGVHDIDEATSGWVSETGSRTETSTPQLDVWRIPVHEQYAMPHATQKILDDSAIDIEGWLSAKVADKLMRTENAAFVNGTGVGQPRGVLTYDDRAAIETYELGKVGRYKTGVNGGFAADPDGDEVLIDALYGLKDQYRANATWFCNRFTMAGLRKLRDGDNNRYWQPSMQAGQPSLLLGHPVVGFEDMPNFTTTGALAILVGDMAAAYQIVDRMGIRVLRDPFTSKPFIKFYTTKRVGGDVIDFDAIRAIEFSA